MTAALLSGAAGQNGYFRSPVHVTLVAGDVDDAPNTLSTFYSINGRPFVKGNSATPTGDGAYALAYFSIDPARNVEATHILTVRIDQTPPVITAFASPATLWPPNNKLVPVTVTGHVADNFSGVAPRVSFQVLDEYGQVQPSGSAAVDASGAYAFVVYLQSSRLGQDKDGRQYVIDVTAHDLAGNARTAATVVAVPHDQGHQIGQGPHGGGHG
jgi:hypothetical protein